MPGKSSRKAGTGCLTMLVLFAAGCIASAAVAAAHKPFWAVGVAWAPFLVLMIIAIFVLPRGKR
jgi:membrane protein YdbS with pleckstrin-like domain